MAARSVWRAMINRMNAMIRGGLMYKKLKFTILMCCCLLLISAPAIASETWLYSIDGIKDPGAIAATPDGNMVVAFPVWNSVKVLDAKGKMLRSMSISHPSSLAVGPTGEIYVGIGKYSAEMPPYITSGEVKVFDSELQYIGSLGSGAGEFISPSAIAVGGDGKIYVADSETNSISIYKSDGTLSLAFGQYGIGDGYLNKPKAIAVDDTTGNIYVADKQLVLNSSGGYVGGARVQVFDALGAYISGFGSYGELVSPSGLAVKNGNTYVSDAYLDLVKVYDAAGVLQTAFSSPGNNMRVPVGMSLSADGLLYVAGSNSNNINVFGIDDYIVFDANPKVLNFEAVSGGALPSDQTVSLTDTGNGELKWKTAVSASWIKLSTASGVVAPGSSVDLVVGADQTGLAVGSYAGTVTVINQNGTAVDVNVTMNVANPPVLSVTPSALSFSAKSGSAGLMSAPVSVSLSNASVTATWEAASDSAWLSVNPVQASSTATDATVSVNAAGLSAGIYTGTISVQSQGAVGSPSSVTVTLTVTSSGSIAVVANIPEATFTITGDNATAFTGSGKNWLATDVPDGTYSIVYGHVPGFKTPASEIKTIDKGNALAFTAAYADLRSMKSIIVSIGSKYETGTIGIFDANGAMTGSFAPFGKKYHDELNVASGDVDGDGIDDIIVGAGTNSQNARVAVFHADGSKIPGADFIALNTSNGAKVAAADCDGDGISEIIVGSGPGSRNAGLVRVFKYDNGVMSDTGVYVSLFTTKYGVNIASGDIDGDGMDEIIVSPGPDPSAGAIAKILKVDVMSGEGNWSVTDTGTAINASGTNYGANVAAGDLNGDGTSEIILSPGNSESARRATHNSFTVYYGNGDPFGVDISLKSSGGLEVAAGDIDMDGNAEIVTALGPKQSNTSLIQVFKKGALDSQFTAFKGSHNGAKIALGQLN